MAHPVEPPEELDPNLVLRAYAMGVFLMAESRIDRGVYWVEPRMRAILPLDGFHLSRSLRRTLLAERFAITIDRDFAGVLTLCAEAAADRPETWISQPIERVFTDLHAMGHAHSVECWREGRLVGGLYGLALGGAFFGESMVSRERDASKVALAALVAMLRTGGFTLLDCQFMTDHLASLGAVEVSRERYLALLGSALGAAESLGPLGVAGRSADFSALSRRVAERRRVAGASAVSDATSPAPAVEPLSGQVIVHALGQTS